MTERRPLMLALNFLMAITMIPVGIELFRRAGEIVIGEAAVAAHPWLTSFFAYIPILILVLIYCRATLDPFSRFGFVRSEKFLITSVIVGVISAISLFGIDILTGLLDDFGIAADPSLALAVGWILALGLLVPFTEELLFRGVIQTVFTEQIKSSWSFHPAILVASGFEVMMHLSVPMYFSNDPATALVAALPQALYVLIFGAIGGFVFHKTKSLTGPFIIHAVGNIGELLLFWAFV